MADDRLARFAPDGFELTPLAASSEPTGPIDRLVVATMWNGPLTVGRLHSDQADPSQATLDQISTDLTARNDGIPPTVRVVERPPWRTTSGKPGSTPRRPR